LTLIVNQLEFLAERRVVGLSDVIWWMRCTGRRIIRAGGPNREERYANRVGFGKADKTSFKNLLDEAMFYCVRRQC